MFIHNHVMQIIRVPVHYWYQPNMWIIIHVPTVWSCQQQEVILYTDSCCQLAIDHYNHYDHYDHYDYVD